MAIKLIPHNTPQWDVPVNENFADLDTRIDENYLELEEKAASAQTQADKYTQESQAKVEALPAAEPGTSGGLALYSQGVASYTHAKSGTVHALTGPAGAKYLTFVATASFTDGDTFTVNGTAVTAKTIDGAGLYTGDFVSGQAVSVALEGSVLTFQFRSYHAALQTKANESDVAAEIQKKLSYGQLGLGKTGVGAPDNDYNNVTESGFYLASATTKNTFSAYLGVGSNAETMISSVWNADAIGQIAITADNRMGWRKKRAGVWLPWKEVAAAALPT